VKASRELSAGHKLVWLEDHALHRSTAGAYIGAGPLGERLGLSRDQVERHRRELLDLGLHAKQARPGGRGVSWYATLPDACVPSERPTAAEVRRLAARLDQHIRVRRGGTDAAIHPFGPVASPDGEWRHPRTRVAASTPPTGGMDAPAVAASMRHTDRTDAAIPAPSVAAPTPPPPAQCRVSDGGTDSGGKDFEVGSEVLSEVRLQDAPPEAGASPARFARAEKTRPDHSPEELDPEARAVLAHWEERRRRAAP